MADCSRHDEGHAAAKPDQAGRYHQEWCPGCGQSGEFGTKLGAEPECSLTHLTPERLIANKWGITGGAIETLRSSRSPVEEVPVVDAAERRPSFRCGGSLAISFNADAMRVGRDETAIATCRVEHQVSFRTDRPPNQAPHHVIRCVICAGILARYRRRRKQLKLRHGAYPDPNGGARLRRTGLLLPPGGLLGRPDGRSLQTPGGHNPERVTVTSMNRRGSWEDKSG